MAAVETFAPLILTVLNCFKIYCPGPATIPETAEDDELPLPDGPAEDGLPEPVGVVDVFPG